MPPQSLTDRRGVLLAGAALCWPLSPARGQTPDPAGTAAFWSALRQPGTVIMMRHAQTEPGVGDPPGFRVEVCSTQRNLSDAGRAQARRVADALTAQDIRPSEVRSSAWCRCLETARLAFGAFGKVTPWPAINSTFQGHGNAERQRAEVLAAVRDWRGTGPLALVTHQVNISAATGEYTSMGEMLAVRHAQGRLWVVGRLAL